ncbi:MAG: ABC transporter ATP-binding protein [Lachnospiraceae bacterium]|nr:ABC transporter ATP-binding protein [Lachnospiraceae bacterium]
MLEIKGLVKRFGSFTAVDGLDMKVEKGSIFGFVGPNGAGKTTTMKIMCGLLKADDGSIFVDRSDLLRKSSDIRERIGYMPDFFGVYDDLKVKEYMDFYEGAYYIPYSERAAITDKLLDMVNLADKKEVYVDSLSRGMKQRLCLARSLVHDPDILVLDEPASGLDPRARMEMKSILKRLSDSGKTIIISSHILPELDQMCSHVGIIEKGRMVAQGTVEEISAVVSGRTVINIVVLDKKDELFKALDLDPLCTDIKLTEMGAEVAFTGGEAQLAHLLGKIVKADIPVVSFDKKKYDLENVFMEVTGGGVDA